MACIGGPSSSCMGRQPLGDIVLGRLNDSPLRMSTSVRAHVSMEVASGTVSSTGSGFSASGARMLSYPTTLRGSRAASVRVMRMTVRSLAAWWRRTLYRQALLTPDAAENSPTVQPRATMAARNCTG